MAKKNKNYKDTTDMFKSLRERLKTDTAKNIIEWIDQNDIRTEDGHKLSFGDRKFLIDVIKDESKKQAIMASAQVGWQKMV